MDIGTSNIKGLEKRQWESLCETIKASCRIGDWTWGSVVRGGRGGSLRAEPGGGGGHPRWGGGLWLLCGCRQDALRPESFRQTSDHRQGAEEGARSGARRVGGARVWRRLR